MTWRRSTSSRDRSAPGAVSARWKPASGAGSDRGSAGPLPGRTSAGRCSGPITSCSAITSARSRTFCNSRTLPGQSYASSRYCASGSSATGPRPCRSVSSRRKWSSEERDVLLALAERRQLQGHHVEPVVEVLAELSVRTSVARSRWVAAMIRTSTLTAASADRHDLALLERAQQPRLQRGRDIADLVEEQRAAVGLTKSPGARPAAPVKAPRTWPKSSLSSRPSARAEQFTATNRRPVRSRVPVDRPGHQLLAGSGLSQEQDTGLGRRDPGYRLHDFDDRRLWPTSSAPPRLPLAGRAGVPRRSRLAVASRRRPSARASVSRKVAMS